METERQLTPKEKFDIEMKQTNKAINIANAPEKEAGYSNDEAVEVEDQVEAVEEAMNEVEKADTDREIVERRIDKHVGTKKVQVTMTREQHLTNKLETQRKEILQKFNQVGGLQKEKLTSFQEKVMAKVLKLAEQGKLDDPVLKHMVGMKIETAAKYDVLNGKIKEVQLMIVDRMAKLATECQESQSNAKLYNRDILLYVQRNPDALVIEEESESES